MMEVSGVILLIILGVFVILIPVLLGIALNDMSNAAFYRKAKEKYISAVQNIFRTYYSSKNYEQCVFELELIFENIIIKNDALSKEFDNIQTVIEKYIVSLNVGEIMVEEQNMEAYKNALHQLLKEHLQRNPMEKIQGSDFVALKQLIECVEHQNVEKGNEIVKQLAVEIKNLQDTNLEYIQNSKKQDAIAKVGIVLSCIFGIMTFIQFFV